MLTSSRSSHSSSTARGRTSLVMEPTSCSNDGASPGAVRGNGSGSPLASVNSGAASQRAMMALVRASAAQARDLLAMNPGEQADAAVGLLLALKGKIMLGDIHEELAQQLRQRREGHSAADAQPDQRTKQPRQRRMQLRRGHLWSRGRLRRPGFCLHCQSVPAETVGHNPTFLMNLVDV